MEGLVKQIRVRLFTDGQGNQEETDNNIRRGLQPQRTQSFEEKKKPQNWLGRYFPTQMSQDYYSNTGLEHGTAVAAAAFAIHSLEEQTPDNNKKKNKRIEEKKREEDSETSLMKTKTKRVEVETPLQEPRTSSRQFSGSSRQFSGEDLTKKSKGLEHNIPASDRRGVKIPEKGISPGPSIKKTPTFPDKNMEIISKKKTETEVPKPYHHATVKPTAGPSGTKGQGLTRSGIGEMNADAWEEAEIAKIKRRYEKLKEGIVSWEEEKKNKARRRLEKAEREPKKREKALKKYNSEAEYIKEIAGGARAKAEERQRKEILKVKEKANVIRNTGELPPTCYCF